MTNRYIQLAQAFVVAIFVVWAIMSAFALYGRVDILDKRIATIETRVQANTEILLTRSADRYTGAEAARDKAVMEARLAAIEKTSRKGP